MADIAKIDRHNFDKAKSQLREFSNMIPNYVDFDRVEEDGPLWMEHSVTGREMNSHIRTVQRRFIDQNNYILKVISEFKEVYNAFDILDKDYIQWIEQNINDCKINSDRIKEQQATLASEQIRIQKAFDGLSLTYEKMSNYKNDIDQGKRSISDIFNKLGLLSNRVESIEHKLSDVQNSMKKSMESEDKFTSRINSISNLLGGLKNGKEKSEEQNVALSDMLSTIQLRNQRLFVATIVMGVAIVALALKVFGVF